jgi:hypothetical protein
MSDWPESEVLWTKEPRTYFLHMLEIKMAPGIFIFYFINIYPYSNKFIYHLEIS